MLKRFRFGGQDSITNPNPNIIRLTKNHESESEYSLQHWGIFHMMIMTQVFSLQTLDSVFFPRKINITFEELVHVTSPESPSPAPQPRTEAESRV